MVAIAVAAVASASAGHAQTSGGNAVFVQTNDPTGNAIDAFQRNGDGTLTFLKSYPTGGLGGKELPGNQSDSLATQGSLRIVDGRFLVAVNAGSDSITVFQVIGDQLERTQILSSGGPFPNSIAEHGNLVYVLDAGGAGFVSGYRIAGDGLQPIAGSTRTLGLANSNPPFFLSSPGQVGFSPDGQHLIVTTKTNSTVDVFSVGQGGLLSATPVKNAAAGVPFAFVFETSGLMVLDFAITSSLQTFTVNADDTITPVSAPAPDGGGALCWITPARGFEYTSNTATNDVSQYAVTANGTVTLVNPVAANNIPGAIDSATAGGAFLYVQSGTSSTVHVFSIGAGGALTLIQVATVPDGGSQEGIVVS
jgi:6-phosphogluconolactonase (cycloisomerase 2 family)